jgi:hypothetical protein
MADNKRNVAAVQRLLKKYGGEVTILEALNREMKGRPSGAPRRWGFDELFKLRVDVETAKASGLKPNQAYRVIAEYYGMTPEIIGNHYAEALKSTAFGPGMVAKQFASRELTEFLRGLHLALKTPRI